MELFEATNEAVLAQLEVVSTLILQAFYAVVPEEGFEPPTKGL